MAKMPIYGQFHFASPFPSAEMLELAIGHLLALMFNREASN